MAGPARTDALSHLRLRLAAMHRALAAAMEYRRGGVGGDVLRDGIADKQAAAILRRLDREARNGLPAVPPIAPTGSEARSIDELRRAADRPLPLDVLEAAGFGSFETDALVVAVAPELDAEYERLYGYVMDDLTRGRPCLELVLRLTSGGTLAEAARRRLLGAAAPLRRLGLLTAELVPGAGVTDWLTGAAAAPPMPLTDPTILPADPAQAAELSVEQQELAGWLARRAQGVLAIWGHNSDDSAVGISGLLNRPLLRCDAPGGAEDIGLHLAAELAAAAARDAIFWLRAGVLAGVAPGVTEQCGSLLAHRSQTILVTGGEPWRPRALLAAGHYRELSVPITVPGPDGWLRAAPTLTASEAERLATRFRFSLSERRAAVALAKAETECTAPTADHLTRNAELVARPARSDLFRIIAPRRQADDLILQPMLHAQVMELAEFYKAAGRVDTAWGLGRMSAADGSVKAIFAGEPGTGKTLAAEVIAGQLGLQLLKVDSAQVVSKWIGETEKNLDAVFRHAEDNHAVLFFDEADTLFGKRGEVRHAADRYANLEVGYLLQRLEEFSGGLAIVATNLRDDVDKAFMRRFHVSLHFPRPEKSERLRLWRLAFGTAPLAADLVIDALAEIDLTGAGIVSTARLAGLLAETEGAGEIGVRHLREAIGRQFRGEARLTSAAILPVDRLASARSA